jgi:Fe-S oxidoreductase
MATRNESASTRARANLLREFLTHSTRENPFNHKELYDILDLCLSCKGCKSECPSNVDMAKLKAEFLQQYYDQNGIPIRTRLIAYISSINKLGMLLPCFYNYFITKPFFSEIIKKTIGFAKERNIPKLYKYSLKKWAGRNVPSLNAKLPADAFKVLFFIEEFTNFNDTEIGIKAIKLLSRLNYKVEIAPVSESGRTFISKGLLRTARKIALQNIEKLAGKVEYDFPLIGIEPSAILTFRDEYPELVKGEMVKHARNIAENTLMVDEFLAREMKAGRIKPEMFTKEEKKIKLHGHCQQKAIASTNSTKTILSFPENYEVAEINSGCCGMAGSFGYEKEHYDISMKIGELVLFPEIRKSGKDTIIAAPGTSCREHIKHGTGEQPKHPVEILFEALL